jgi:rSAM-associated Gly-rich repeat protein
MKNTSITKSLPALLTITGGAVIAASGNADAAQAAQPERVNALETRVKQVQDKLGEQQDQQQPGLAFEQKTTEDGLQTFWWGNWHNGGWGPGAWHNWGNGGWHNWRNGWGNGGWHNWHNWGNF